ncbi:MAG: cache domain-containing protein, partial [Vicinamibacterales bacterium]
MKMRGITARFVLFVVTAAIFPLAIYGIVSAASLYTGTTESVQTGNARVAAQVAAHVDLYMTNNTRVLQAIGTEFGAIGLGPSQQDRTLKDYGIDFPEFREITVFDRAGNALATSAVGATRLAIPAEAQTTQGPYIAPIKVDDDLLPTTTIAVRLTRAEQQAGWVVGEIALETLWRTVKEFRVGSHGYALIVDRNGRLIAHGNPDAKRLIAVDQSPAAPELQFASEFRASHTAESSKTYRLNGEQMLAVAAAVQPPASNAGGLALPDTGWT